MRIADLCPNTLLLGTDPASNENALPLQNDDDAASDAQSTRSDGLLRSGSADSLGQRDRSLKRAASDDSLKAHGAAEKACVAAERSSWNACGAAERSSWNACGAAERSSSKGSLSLPGPPIVAETMSIDDLQDQMGKAMDKREKKKNMSTSKTGTKKNQDN